jgi:hypothetical protein
MLARRSARHPAISMTAETGVFRCTDRQAVLLMRIARRYFEKRAKRKSRLGHSVINVFMNEWDQWRRAILWVTEGG